MPGGAVVAAVVESVFLAFKQPVISTIRFFLDLFAARLYRRFPDEVT